MLIYKQLCLYISNFAYKSLKTDLQLRRSVSSILMNFKYHNYADISMTAYKYAYINMIAYKITPKMLFEGS